MKNEKDLAQALVEVPTMFEAGITSIAIDASHQPNDQNLLANLAVDFEGPGRGQGLETIKSKVEGSTGLSTPDEALFLIQGLNAHDIFADWIALNNGTTHGSRRASRHRRPGRADRRGPRGPRALQHSGAQHGTSGNSSTGCARSPQRPTPPRPMWRVALQNDSLGPRGQRLRQRAARRRRPP